MAEDSAAQINKGRSFYHDLIYKYYYSHKFCEYIQFK